MTSPAHDDLAAGAAALARATRTAHRSVLVLIAACALAILWFGGDASGAQPRAYTYAAIGLAVATIAMRRFSGSPGLGLRARLYWALGSLACAAGLGLAAAAIGIEHGDTQAGLVISLGAAVFVIRPPEAATLALRNGPPGASPPAMPGR